MLCVFSFPLKCIVLWVFNARPVQMFDRETAKYYLADFFRWGVRGTPQFFEKKSTKNRYFWPKNYSRLFTTQTPFFAHLGENFSRIKFAGFLLGGGGEGVPSNSLIFWQKIPSRRNGGPVPPQQKKLIEKVFFSLPSIHGK